MTRLEDRSSDHRHNGVLRSDHAPVEVGGATLDAMVRATAARVPRRPALVDGASGDGVTYAELVRRADRVAALLAERGLGPGDVRRSRTSWASSPTSPCRSPPAPRW